MIMIEPDVLGHAEHVFYLKLSVAERVTTKFINKASLWLAV